MRIERAKNASRNVVVGFILKIYQLLGPFITRTILIRTLGIEYLGLNSLFSSILHVLNLAELGVSSAMVFSMYKPIAEDDETTICDLMKIYKIYYRFIGIIILLIGLILTPVLPFLIKGDVPSGANVYILYYLNLASTVLSYWLFAYRNSILIAHQRNDIISKVTIFSNTFMYLGQIFVLAVFKNYYAYLVMSLGSQALLNVCTAIKARSMFPQYNPSKRMNKALAGDINKKIRDLFTSKVGEIIVTSADSIVISAFLGLAMLASYNSYYYILSSVFGFIVLFLQACTAGIGNSLVTESEEKNYKDLNKIVMIIAWVGGFCASCLMCLYQPFMVLWIGNDNLLPVSCVVCLVLFFYVNCINQTFIVYKDAAGMWHEDRFRPIVTALTNLFLNLIMVRIIGIYGVLLSTVISVVVVGMPWVLNNIFTLLFHRSKKDLVRRIIYYSLMTFIAVGICYYVCTAIPLTGIAAIFIRLIVCMVISNFVFLIAYHKLDEFQSAINMLDSLVGSKIKLVHVLCLKLEKKNEIS